MAVSGSNTWTLQLYFAVVRRLFKDGLDRLFLDLPRFLHHSFKIKKIKNEASGWAWVPTISFWSVALEIIATFRLGRSHKSAKR
jgi:hypothetical protein